MAEDRRCFRYRLNAGEVEAVMFNSPDDVPEGQGWVDTPAKLDQASLEPASPESAEPVEAAPEPVADPDPEPELPATAHDSAVEKLALLEKAAELGVSVDGRWGVERLTAEIAKAEGAE